MKFGKEFSSRMVPEWQHAYMDYRSLKTCLKHRDRHHRGLNRKMTLDSCLQLFTPRRQRLDHSQDVEGGVQLTATTTTRGPIQVETTTNGQVQTKFQMEEEVEKYEREFLGRLDNEFNKVQRFYKKKVVKVLKEEERLTGELEALFKAGSKHNHIQSSFWTPQKAANIAFGAKVKNPERCGREEREEETAPLASGISTSTPAIPPSSPVGAKPIEKGESSRAGQLEDGATESVHELDTSMTRAARQGTPYTVDGVTRGNIQEPKKSELKLNIKTLGKDEKKLKDDYVKFYRELINLQTYCISNAMAFSKIMKKYEKISTREARMPYMKVVDRLFLKNSEQVVQITKRVEDAFIEQFAEKNRPKGMKILRPKMTRERHRVTFSTGFLAGCVFSLIVALAAIIRTRDILQEEGQKQYMDTMFPLYSWFGFIMLHIVMYAVNIYYWRRYKVNYSKIFGFKQGTELGHRQVLLVAFSIGVFALLCVLANLDMEVDPETKDYEVYTELLPLFLLIGIFGVLFLPFDFFYGSNRKFYLTCLFHCIAAPLYKVSFADSFLGDQFTSQVQALRSFEFYICYYGCGDFKHRINTCDKSHAYKGFFFIVAVIPYVSRLLQCMRRLFDERNWDQGRKKNWDQGFNGLKYLLTIVAVCLRTAYSIQQGQIAWRVLAMITSVVAAIFGTYWDFVHDWGLLNRSSENPWLRDKLLIPQKEVYFVAMILNVLLRFAWIQTVLDFNFSFMHTQTMIAVVASLEIIRRGIWNFFRLENEHLKNVKNE